MSSDSLFDVHSKLNRRIRTSRAYWDYITKIKHPSINGLAEEVKATLREPVEIRRSKRDHMVHLYYGRHQAELLCCVVVKFLNGEGFIITAYLTRRMVGNLVWKNQ